MSGFGGVEGFVCKGVAGLVDGALSERESNAEVSTLEVCIADNSLRLVWSGFGEAAYPSEQVVLQIEFASSRAQLLDLLDNLDPALDALNCSSHIPRLVPLLPRQ